MKYNCPRCKKLLITKEKNKDFIDFSCTFCSSIIFIEPNECSINISINNSNSAHNIFYIKETELFFKFNINSEEIKIPFFLDFDNVNGLINKINKLKVFI